METQRRKAQLVVNQSIDDSINSPVPVLDKKQADSSVQQDTTNKTFAADEETAGPKLRYASFFVGDPDHLPQFVDVSSEGTVFVLCHNVCVAFH